MHRPDIPARLVPPRGIPISDSDSRRLNEAVSLLEARVEAVRADAAGGFDAALRWPDVIIFSNAVRYALEQDIFFEERDVEIAGRLLAVGAERMDHLEAGEAPWAAATGLVPRGYVSRLDGSVQPYGLVVPGSFSARSDRRHRLDIWHHGRNNRLSELRFLDAALDKAGEFTPEDAFVLHTYGRYCNAMKFAGEVDTFEALDHAKRNYPIDDDRINVRGFSMGGAATWHMAVHHTDVWCAATPGAGFAETPAYQDIFRKNPKPAWWEQKLWRWYDATDWAANLHRCPVVAYSGELDRQMQAADIMAEAMRKEGLDLVHVIGSGMGHRFDEESKTEIERRLSGIVEKGRTRVPRKVRFTTWTLRYAAMDWVHVDGLEQHWERATVDAEMTNDTTVTVRTTNVSALTLRMPAGQCPLTPLIASAVVIDDTPIPVDPVDPGGIWEARFAKADGQWTYAAEVESGDLRKRPGLQGPIDDAFLDSFLHVIPTGEPLCPEPVTRWIADEHAEAVYQWTMQFRGRPRLKPDRAVTAGDLAAHNLVLWGDPGSNALTRKIILDLPLQWSSGEVSIDRNVFLADRYVPVLIYPNPLNPERYVVLNSGFTFAQWGAASNSLQTPKLPDWAVLDITVPAEQRIPFGVADCGFFDESWRVA